MKAIETRYLGPTNHKPARIKAYDLDGNRITISYPHTSGRMIAEDAHRIAAETLRDKMQWSGRLIGGATKAGYAFVFVPETNDKA